MQRSHPAPRGRASRLQSTARGTRAADQRQGRRTPQRGHPRAAGRMLRSDGITRQTECRAPMARAQQAPCWVVTSTTRSGGGAGRRRSKSSRGTCGACSMAAEQVPLRLALPCLCATCSVASLAARSSFTTPLGMFAAQQIVSPAAPACPALVEGDPATLLVLQAQRRRSSCSSGSGRSAGLGPVLPAPGRPRRHRRTSCAASP